MWVAIVSLGTDCWADVGWAELGASMLFAAATGCVVAASWGFSLSALRWAVGRRGLRRRSWLALAVFAGAVASAYLCYAAAVAPEVARLNCGLQLH